MRRFLFPPSPISAHPHPALPTISNLRQTVTNLTTKRYLFTAFFHASASLNAALALQQSGRETEERKREGDRERGGRRMISDIRKAAKALFTCGRDALGNLLLSPLPLLQTPLSCPLLRSTSLLIRLQRVYRIHRGACNVF